MTSNELLEKYFWKLTNKSNIKGYNQIERDLQVLELIKKHPDELGFICDCENYSEYVRTFLDAEMELEDVAYTEEEFNFIKGAFNNECNS